MQRCVQGFYNMSGHHNRVQSELCAPMHASVLQVSTQRAPGISLSLSLGVIQTVVTPALVHEAPRFSQEFVTPSLSIREQSFT